MESVFTSENMCCGCGACAEACPQNAVTMASDDRGFLYPSVDTDKCIDCGICQRVCGNKPVEDNGFDKIFYAAKLKNDEERKRSRSGGTFFAMAKSIIVQGGVVYGVIIDENLEVKIARAVTIEECIPMQGSKYIESEIFGTYSSIFKDLEIGRKVLICATPCQIAGLYGYLSIKKNVCMDNLYTIDIVCNGVSSRKIYQDYLKFVEKKFDGKVQNFNFRDKEFGWDTNFESFIINGKKHRYNNYSYLYYSGMAVRSCCDICQFTSFNRPADVTIADFWGLKNHIQDFDDNKGVSAVMINTQKGKDLFYSVTEFMDVVQVPKSYFNHHNLRHPTKFYGDKNKFWTLYNQKGIVGVLKKYGRYDLGRRFKWRFVDLPKLKKN